MGSWKGLLDWDKVLGVQPATAYRVFESWKDARIPRDHAGFAGRQDVAAIFLAALTSPHAYMAFIWYIACAGVKRVGLVG